MAKLDDELTGINEKIVGPSRLKLTDENFLNPLNSLDLQMRAADMPQMDLLARKIFLNLEIDQQKTILYRDKEPFQTLISGVKTGQITCGEPGGTSLLLRKSLPFLVARKTENKFSVFTRSLVRSNPSLFLATPQITK